MVRTNEGGSVLGFVIVGVILTAAMIGGVVLVRQQAANTRKPAPSKVVGVDKSKPAAPTPAPSDNNKTPVAPAPSTESTPAPSSGNTPAPQPTTPAPATNQLPHTGPAETLTSLVAVAFLGGSTAAYMQSRRAARRLYQLPSASI